MEPVSAPPPLTVHVTPAAFLSLVTLAVRVTESLPSTVEFDADAVTLMGLLLLLELPPLHADMANAATKTHKTDRDLFADTGCSF